MGIFHLGVAKMSGIAENPLLPKSSVINLGVETSSINKGRNFSVTCSS